MDHEEDSSITDEELEGQYANHYRVGYNAFEFLIEFGQLYEGESKARFHTRIISNPIYIKELFKILRESIESYENHYGPINDEAD
jgi:hypothetical protein